MMLPGVDHAKLTTCVERLVGVQDAEDVLQTVYLRLLRAPIDTTKSAPMTWAYTLAHQASAAFLKTRHRRQSHEVATATLESWAEASADPTLAQIEQAHELEVLLEILSAEQRQALTLWSEGFSMQEAADKIGVPFTTFRRRLDTARRLIRDAT